MGLLAEAHASEGQKVAEGASKVLEDLYRYFQAEDDARQMKRLVPAPSALEENGGEAEPAKTVTVWGSMTTQNVAGGPPRGNLEGELRYLASLSGSSVTVVGVDDNEASGA